MIPYGAYSMIGCLPLRSCFQYQKWYLSLIHYLLNLYVFDFYSIMFICTTCYIPFAITSYPSFCWFLLYTLVIIILLPSSFLFPLILLFMIQSLSLAKNYYILNLSIVNRYYYAKLFYLKLIRNNTISIRLL